MSIPALFHQGRVLSLEVFPPKPDAPIEVIDGTLSLLAPIKPDYISVTYGAGGSGRSRSVGSFCPLDHDGLLAVYRAANH